MRAFLSISLLILFLSNSIFKAGIIFNYWQNEAEIIANCCINKNKPELNCNGKCYVGSELNKVDTKKENAIPTRVMLQDFEMLLFLNETTPRFTFFINKQWPNNFKTGYTSQWTTAVFHPPTC